jgi:hypothetical protein
MLSHRLTLKRRTLIGSIPACALFTQIGRSQAALQPAILQNEIGFQPSLRELADWLRTELLRGPVSCQFVGAYPDSRHREKPPSNPLHGRDAPTLSV